MMEKKWLKEYPIERELARLVKEFKLSLRKVTNFFFVLPKRKEDKLIYLMETMAWLFLTLALILRVIGR